MKKELNFKLNIGDNIKDNGRNRILTDLPKNKNGKNNWKETIGMELELLYNNEIYKVKVIRYKNNRIWIDYNGYVHDKGIDPNHFKEGGFGGILKLKTNEFKHDIGKTFKDDKRDITITNRECRLHKRKSRSDENEKWYKYTCNVCGWTEGWVVESALKSGNGCSCCAGKTVVPHINSIKAKTPWMIDLGVSEEDAIKYTPSSNKKTKVVCPDCGKKRQISISNIHQYKSIGCTCGDGIKYPEKFTSNVLMQLGIKFETQLSKTTFEWIGDKKYDFYLPDYNTIIETHGEQHYRETSNFKRTLEEEKINDEFKMELASANGINKYIVIDCRYSEIEWIKKSMLESKLNKIFDLSGIDWLECEKFALKNMVKEVCDYWNNKEEWETTTDLGKVFGLCGLTVRNYLKKGVKHAWCKYDPREELVKSISKTRRK